MKKFYYTLICAFLAVSAYSQKENVGIGTVSPDQSALLDLSSKSKGLLIPRMSLAQRNGISNPAQGLMIFQSDNSQGFYFYDGKKWSPLNSNEAKSLAAAGSGASWTEDGNNISTTPSAFIGTTGAGQALVFKTQGLSSGKIDPVSQSIYLGFSSGYNNSASAARNVGMGTSSLGSLASGASNGVDNVALGYQALSKISTGANNVAIGSYALANAINSTENFALGYAALGNVIGNGNIAIGPNTLNSLTTGDNNLAIGRSAGLNKQGSDNIYIGTDAGRSATAATESSTLHIGSSLGGAPLIKGNLATNNLQINSKTTGYLAIGDFNTPTSASPGIGGLPLPANIGMANGYRLVVQDGILCEKVKVALRATGSSDWADYVFEPEYKAKMMTLEEIEAFAIANKHLPNVPTTAEVQRDGIDVHQTSKMLLEKIEELTLYMIDLNKEVKALKAENEILKRK